MTIDEIQQKIYDHKAQIASLEQELTFAKRQAAPRCKCGRVLFNDRGGYTQFVAVQTTTGECFEFCDNCAHEYIKEHGWKNKGGTVAGAWDCPDPMGL